MNQPRPLFDWQAEAARDLDLMRANTARLERTGIIFAPHDVKIRKFKQGPVGRQRKAHAG